MTARAPRSSAPAVAALLAVLVAVLALAASCTAPGGDSGRSTGAGSSSAAAYPSTAATSAAASSDGAPAGMTPPSSRASTTPSSTAPSTTTASSSTAALPGGGGDRAALAAAGNLADGRITLHSASAAAASPSQPDSAALCAFLFGTPAEIADLTRLGPDLAIDPLSGRHGVAPDDRDDDTDDGTDGAAVIACVYQADGTPVLALQVGDGPPVDPNLPGQPIIVDVAGLHAVLSYSPDHVGPTIDPATARAWLVQALGRVAPADAG